MAVDINKHSVMTLFSGTTDIFSHQVRIVLAEKGISVEIKQISPCSLPQTLIDLNPYHTVPTLVDRELTLYESRIIMEYLDERFPHPPLMPAYPIARGTSRLMMHRIENDWYTLMNTIEKNQGKEKDIENARQQLYEELLAVAPVFNKAPFFMSEEFSLVDCYLTPLLWRLPKLGIDLASTKELEEYTKRVFTRNTFLASLTTAECKMRL